MAKRQKPTARERAEFEREGLVDEDGNWIESALAGADEKTLKYLESKGFIDEREKGGDVNVVGGTGDSDEFLMKALGLTERQYEENKAAIDKAIEQSNVNYFAAALLTDRANMETILNLKRKEKGLKPIKAEKFVGAYKSAAAKAKADPNWIREQKASFGEQKEALGELKSRIDPTMTDAERVIVEMNRRAQEQDLRGARSAALSSARARGFGGAGAEMQVGLAAQQEGSERRMLQDLAASGQAVQRGERALRDYGQMAGEMTDRAGNIRGQTFDESFQRGTAADDASRFNRTLRQDYDKYKTKTRRDAQTDKWGRVTDIGDREFGASADRYNMLLGGERANERYTGMRTGQGSSDVGATTSVLGELAGDRAAKDAIAALGEDDDGGFDPLGWIGL